jgi:hypothetical protein
VPAPEPFKFWARIPDYLSVERGGGNGGFPEPPAGEPVRLVRAQHQSCGSATRIRLPGALTAQAVRRVVCDSCWQPYVCEAGEVEDLGAHLFASGQASPNGAPSTGIRRPRFSVPKLKTRPRAPHWPSFLGGRAWRIVSVLIAAVAVVGLLSLIEGGDSGAPTGIDSSAAPAVPGSPQVDGGAGAAGGAGASGHAKLIQGSNYSLALPAGWERTSPQGGSTFTASAADGMADATLWIRNDPSLTFPNFEARSLTQLRQLAGSAHVVSRQAAPTPEATVVRLAADSPPGEPTYDVTLRVAGPYRYYLSTTVQPNASGDAVEGADLIRNSFVPEISGGTGK